MHRRVAALFVLALLSCAIPAHVAFASTDAAAAASPIDSVQEFVAAVVNSTEAIIAEAETGISDVVATIARLASSGAPTSYSAAVAASQISPSVSPTQPPLAAPNTAPTPPTEAQVLPVVRYDAVATPPSTDNILKLQSAVAGLADSVQSLTALLQSQTPSAKIESQIAALQALALRATYHYRCCVRNCDTAL